MYSSRGEFLASVTRKLGICVICGDRVFNGEHYLKSADGYCHRGCLTDAGVTA